MAIEQRATKQATFKALLDEIISDEYSGSDALDLSYQGLTDKDIRDLVVALKRNQASKSETKIKHLKLSGSHLSGNAVQELLHPTRDMRVPEFSLVTLDMSRGGLSAEGFEELCKCLPHNKTLKTLNLSGNQLSGKQIRQLADVLGSGELSVEREIVSDTSCNRTLAALDLSYNEMGEEGAEALARVVEKPDCSLTHLNLIGCRMRFKGAKTLMRAISTNTSIRTLSLDESCLSAPAVIAAASNMVVVDGETIKANRVARAARNAAAKAKRGINGDTKDPVVEEIVFKVMTDQTDQQAAANEAPVLSAPAKKESRARASFSAHESGDAPLKKTPPLIPGSALSVLLSNKTITHLELFREVYVAGQRIFQPKKLNERLKLWLTENLKNQVWDDNSRNKPIEWEKVRLQEEDPPDLEELFLRQEKAEHKFEGGPHTAHFFTCQLPGADFREAENFNKTELKNTCLERADLSGLDLRKREESRYFLNGSDLSEANLDGVILDIRSAYALDIETEGLSANFKEALSKKAVEQFQVRYRERLERENPKTHEFLYGKKGSFFPGFFSLRKFNPLAENLTLRDLIKYVDSQEGLGSRSRRICCDDSFQFVLPKNIADLNFSDGFYVRNAMASLDDFAAAMC